MVVMRGYDCTDVRDLTRAEIEGRRQALLAIEALRRFTPGFENARLRTFGMTLGTRDSRKIVGRYDLTGHDVRSEARFDDSIGIFPEFIDGYGLLVLPTTGRYFQVPYGILVPQGVDNLLVAGRCVAGDKVSHAATRSQMCCAVTGQAAGVAAAVSLKDGRPPARWTCAASKPRCSSRESGCSEGGAGAGERAVCTTLRDGPRRRRTGALTENSVRSPR